jgi:hypothetical protein
MVEKTKEKMGSFCSVCSSSSLTGGSSFWPRVKNTRRRKSSKVEDSEDESSNYLKKEEREREEIYESLSKLEPSGKTVFFFFNTKHAKVLCVFLFRLIGIFFQFKKFKLT